MALPKFACDDCTACFSDDDDADAHAERTGHFVYQNPPADSRSRVAEGFDPAPTTEHDDVSVVRGERTGRRRGDY